MISLLTIGLAITLARAATPTCEGLLLNAASSGFGPTAAIAQLEAKLRDTRYPRGFIGERPAFELQQGRPYRDLVELPTDASDDDVRRRLVDLRPRYSHFFSAQDFRYARLAREAGFKVGVYDSLTWFWTTLPDEIPHLNLYIVQNFEGVAARLTAGLTADPPQFPALTWIAPPLAPQLRGRPIARRAMAVLVNIGGLRRGDASLEFAGALAEQCDEVLSELFRSRTFSVKPDLVQALPTASAFTTTKMRRRLERTRLALMTPGLDAVHEASSAGTPIVWLPPTNEAQGRQLGALDEHGVIDARVSWDEFTPLPPIDYSADPKAVLNEIEARMNLFVSSESVRNEFRSVLRLKVRAVLAQKQKLRLPEFTRRFGANGADELAEMLRTWTAYDF